MMYYQPYFQQKKKLGVLKPEIAALFGFNKNVTVSTGGGDNMMGAIGTGNIHEGIATMSLGTSGTLYASTNRFFIKFTSDDCKFLFE